MFQKSKPAFRLTALFSNKYKHIVTMNISRFTDDVMSLIYMIIFGPGKEN